MNKELGGEGIKSTALCPAFVDTPMTDFVKEQVPAEEMIRPEDIAESVRVPAAGLPGLRRARRSCSCAPASRSSRSGAARATSASAAGRAIRPASPAPRPRTTADAPAQTPREDLAGRVGSVGQATPAAPAHASAPPARGARRSPGRAPGRRPLRGSPRAGRPGRRTSRSVARRRPAAGAGEAVPGLGEGEEVGAPAAAVGGQHRADAAMLVDVGADDDPLVGRAGPRASLSRVATGMQSIGKAQALDGAAGGGGDFA